MLTHPNHQSQFFVRRLVPFGPTELVPRNFAVFVLVLVLHETCDGHFRTKCTNAFVSFRFRRANGVDTISVIARADVRPTFRQLATHFLEPRFQLRHSQDAVLRAVLRIRVAINLAREQAVGQCKSSILHCPKLVSTQEDHPTSANTLGLLGPSPMSTTSTSATHDKTQVVARTQESTRTNTYLTELKRCAAWNICAGTTCTIAIVRADHKRGFCSCINVALTVYRQGSVKYLFCSTFAQINEAFVPSLDDISGS